MIRCRWFAFSLFKMFAKGFKLVLTIETWILIVLINLWGELSLHRFTQNFSFILLITFTLFYRSCNNTIKIRIFNL